MLLVPYAVAVLALGLVEASGLLNENILSLSSNEKDARSDVGGRQQWLLKGLNTTQDNFGSQHSSFPQLQNSNQPIC